MILRLLLVTLFLLSPSSAVTPFSLEGITGVNVKVLDKRKFLSKEENKELTKKVKQEIEKLGITSKSKNFSNMLVKVQGIKVEETYVLNVSFIIAEDVFTDNGEKIEKLGITYQQSDFFDSTDLRTDLIESIEYLLEEFVEQYKEEN